MLPIKSLLTISLEYFIPIMRKPGFYAKKITIDPILRKKNLFFKVLRTKEKHPHDVLVYLEFGKQIGIPKRSNTKKLGSNWYYLNSRNINLSRLFLTFKWDSRFRAFLVNYSVHKLAAGQTFWNIIVKNDHYSSEISKYLAVWYNSSIGVAFLYQSADIQRKVWRQLSGNQLKRIVAPSLDSVHLISEETNSLFKRFLEYKHTDSLLIQLNQCLICLQNKELDSNLRLAVDLYFFNIILPNKTQLNAYNNLEKFYIGFLTELKILNSRT